MELSTPHELEHVRQMAQRLDCLIEEDFQTLAQATPKTVEAWRKRGQGPAYILLGRRYLYPLKAVAKYLEQQTRERTSIGAKAIL